MKRISSLIALLTMFYIPLYCVGFGYSVMDIRTTAEFARGIFPSSLLYQFNIPVPDFVPGSKTLFSFRLDNGLEYRKLRQDPRTGEHYASDPEKEENQFPKDYMVLFDEWGFVFGQGFLKMTATKKDLVTPWITLGGRFENAYERLSWMTGPENVEGVFHKDFNTIREEFLPETLIGTPELAGNRSVHQLYISLGLDIDYMKDETTRRNGIKNSTWVRFSPGSIQFLGDSSADFYLLWNKLSLSWTPFAIRQEGKRNTTWLSLVFDNSTTYRVLWGSKIPYYVTGGDIWGAKGANTQHNITNRTSLTLYGPQINSYDCYPFISAFLDVGYSFGKSMNRNVEEVLSDTYMSAGVRAELVIFNVASIYYEYGYVFDNTLNEKPYGEHRFGFSAGI